MDCRRAHPPSRRGIRPDPALLVVIQGQQQLGVDLLRVLEESDRYSYARAAADHDVAVLLQPQRVLRQHVSSRSILLSVRAGGTWPMRMAFMPRSRMNCSWTRSHSICLKPGSLGVRAVVDAVRCDRRR